MTPAVSCDPDGNAAESEGAAGKKKNKKKTQHCSAILKNRVCMCVIRSNLSGGKEREGE